MFLMKAQVTRKKIHLPELFFCELWSGKCQEPFAIFYLVKIKMSIDIFGSENCKVTFGFKYINPLKLNEPFHPYQLVESIANLRVVVFLYYYSKLIEHSVSKQWRP